MQKFALAALAAVLVLGTTFSASAKEMKFSKVNFTIDLPSSFKVTEDTATQVTLAGTLDGRPTEVFLAKADDASYTDKMSKAKLYAAVKDWTKKTSQKADFTGAKIKDTPHGYWTAYQGVHDGTKQHAYTWFYAEEGHLYVAWVVEDVKGKGESVMTLKPQAKKVLNSIR